MASRSANPAALVAGEEETYSHAERVIKSWAETSAAQLEEPSRLSFTRGAFRLVRRCWCSRQSLHTQPFAYAALVPCSRSSRRAAVRAASSALDHPRSILASPHTC